MESLLHKAKLLFEQHNLTGSLQVVNTIIGDNPLNGGAYLLRARIYYKQQLWGQAMNDYFSVLEIEPDNQEAKSGIDMTKSILGYFTPDMFNP